MTNFAKVFQDELAPAVLQYMLDNDIISKIDDEDVYSNYVRVNKYLTKVMVEADENLVEVNVLKIPFDEYLKLFIKELPKEVNDKLESTHYVDNHYHHNISISYPDGTLIAKTGNYIFQDVNNGNVWVKSFLEDEENETQGELF